MKDSWISVAEQLPKLPDFPVCNMFVIVCNEDDTVSRPMMYARRQFRGQPVEKWLTASGGETYRTPDYWQPMPQPTKRKKGN